MKQRKPNIRRIKIQNGRFQVYQWSQPDIPGRACHVKSLGSNYTQNIYKTALFSFSRDFPQLYILCFKPCNLVRNGKEIDILIGSTIVDELILYGKSMMTLFQTVLVSVTLLENDNTKYYLIVEHYNTLVEINDESNFKALKYRLKDYVALFLSFKALNRITLAPNGHFTSTINISITTGALDDYN